MHNNLLHIEILFGTTCFADENLDFAASVVVNSPLWAMRVRMHAQYRLSVEFADMY